MPAGQTWTITSQSEDCAVLVAWIDEGDEAQLPLDDQGHPSVDIATGRVSFDSQ